MFVVLLTFFSASLPRKPMRVILLRYIRFSCSARLSRAPGSEWARLPRPEAAFLGDRHGGARTGTVPRAKQKLRRRRAPREPRSCAETEGGTGTDLKQSRHGWSQPPKNHATRIRRIVMPIGRGIDAAFR